jgi:hypothetical protein
MVESADSGHLHYTKHGTALTSIVSRENARSRSKGGEEPAELLAIEPLLAFEGDVIAVSCHYGFKTSFRCT